MNELNDDQGRAIERVALHDAAALDVLAAAFAQHPMVPPDPAGKPEHWGARLMMGAMVEVFGRGEGAALFGARVEGALACVAFVHPGGWEPGLWGMARLSWAMWRVHGLRRMAAFLRAMGEIEHADKARCLSLQILGTAEGYQGRGLGRAMLRHVAGYAREAGYAAVTLEVVAGTPAVRLYESEGYVEEKTVEVVGEALVLMRCELEDTASPGPG
ncbi:MAG: GNAT family N-acetyltransferase [Planctomycetota bacterium]